MATAQWKQGLNPWRFESEPVFLESTPFPLLTLDQVALAYIFKVPVLFQRALITFCNSIFV